MFGELLLYCLTELSLRSAVKDAIEYKRNKRQKKQFYMERTLFQRILRSYLPKQSNAPRHLCFFQMIRVVNLLWLLFIAFTAVFPAITDISESLFYAKFYLLYLPYCLYVLYDVLFCSHKSGKKQIDFSRFKNP